MDWTPIVATALGGAITAGAALFGISYQRNVDRKERTREAAAADARANIDEMIDHIAAMATFNTQHEQFPDDRSREKFDELSQRATRLRMLALRFQGDNHLYQMPKILRQFR